MGYQDVDLLRDRAGIPIPQYFDPVANAYKPMTNDSNVLDITFLNAVTAVGNGSVLNVGGNKTLTIEITGTSTSRTIIFEGASSSGAYYSITGVNLQDLSMATQTTGKDQVWTFDITGLVSFRTRLSAVAGGNLTVKGRVIS